MYIACPKCETKFVVTAEQIGSHGRKVKCSKCANIWHQKLDNNVKIEPKPAPLSTTPVAIGNGVNLPVLLPIKMPSFLYGLPVLLIGMIIFMVTTLFSNVFEVHSILNNKNLSTHDLQITNDKDQGKILVSYKILNTSDKNVKMPLVRIRLLDKNNRVINTKIDDYSKIELSPGQNVYINTEFADAPLEAENIDVTLGNKLDFILW